MPNNEDLNYWVSIVIQNKTSETYLLSEDLCSSTNCLVYRPTRQRIVDVHFVSRRKILVRTCKDCVKSQRRYRLSQLDHEDLMKLEQLLGIPTDELNVGICKSRATSILLLGLLVSVGMESPVLAQGIRV